MSTIYALSPKTLYPTSLIIQLLRSIGAVRVWFVKVKTFIYPKQALVLYARMLVLRICMQVLALQTCIQDSVLIGRWKVLAIPIFPTFL